MADKLGAIQVQSAGGLVNRSHPPLGDVDERENTLSISAVNTLFRVFLRRLKYCVPVSGDPNATVAILLKMRAALRDQLKQERLRPLGYSDRTQFIRDAIAEKLGLDKELALMKSREGVGGSPTHRDKPRTGKGIHDTFPPHKSAADQLNDAEELRRQRRADELINARKQPSESAPAPRAKPAP